VHCHVNTSRVDHAGHLKESFKAHIGRPSVAIVEKRQAIDGYDRPAFAAADRQAGFY
jgi:hypothetical protein